MKAPVAVLALLVLFISVWPQAAVEAEDLASEKGAVGAWHRILKLTTTASILHTHPHPDDEQGGLLTLLSRGQGVHTSVLTMNRGEAGANAIGDEVFDALGLLRTEELRVAGRYYGVDEQYFTTTADYGFSKRLDEAAMKWGDTVLADAVRVIRMSRPLVLISRSKGNQRNGQGDPETDALVTREAFRVAGDAKAFPEQIAEGLRPWQPLKVYIGGKKESEDWAVRIDSGAYSPWLGETYSAYALAGLSFQRSQNSGRVRWSRGPQYGYYERVESRVASATKEEGFFDGIDTTLPGLFTALGRTAPLGVELGLRAIEREVTGAVAAFSLANPSATAPFLARGLQATRDVLARLGSSEPDATFFLRVKERQFEAALTASLGIDFTAMAQPLTKGESSDPAAEPLTPLTMPAPVPGQAFQVRAQFSNRSPVDVNLLAIRLRSGEGITVSDGAQPSSPTLLQNNHTQSQRFEVSLAENVPISSKSYFTRSQVQQSTYDVVDPKQIHRPTSEAPLVAVARYDVLGLEVEAREVVRRREANLPYGYEMRELRVVPALALTLTPSFAVVPLKARKKQVQVEVDLRNQLEGEMSGTLSLRLPAGWTSTPASRSFHYSRAGEGSAYPFTVSIPTLDTKPYQIQAVAKTTAREYKEGYSIIAKRDLETRLLYRPSTISVRGIDVLVPPGLRVGYVMGAGDQIPAGLAQLGATVTLLGAGELSGANLSRFDAIMTGTRAYAVREDLKTYNQRLLDYVKAGGNLIVLYNTQEFIPNQFAPYPAQLPSSAEEVSEEDSPLEILAPLESVLNYPNQITKADFEGWVEQRGSKFFTEWDQAYTPMIATWDKGQDKQAGGWVQAAYGEGHYTYFAYALHRQIPYGVPGAFRILANLLSISRANRKP